MQKHGMTGTRIHKIYCSMKNRCVNETKSSKYYKDKGITVCDEWLGQNGFVNFYNWAINNGYSDDLDSYNCSIDRIDNEKGYSPDNCRWVDKFTQNNNRSNVLKIEYNGETKTIAEWARIYDIPHKTLFQRIKRNIPFEKAIIYEKKVTKTPDEGDKIFMCKTICYMRVSTSEKSAKQDYERQKYLLAQSGLDFDEVYEEHISGAIKGDQREQFNKMLETLDEKDLVCFTETSRFGRNYIDCFEMLDLITQKKKASVMFLSNGVRLEGGEKMNPYTWMTVSQFFIQDEFLKRQIGYNTSNALQRKKEQGIKLGRRPKFDSVDKVRVLDLYASGLTMLEVAEQTGISKASVCRIINEKVKE